MCRPKGLLGRGQRAERYFSHFPRGLRHHRYFCVALRGFWAEGRERRDIFLISRGAYTTIAIFVSPYGAFGQRAEGGEIFFSHFPRGLRHRRYFSVALRGFWAEGGEIFFSFPEGLTLPSLF